MDNGSQTLYLDTAHQLINLAFEITFSVMVIHSRTMTPANLHPFNTRPRKR